MDAKLLGFASQIMVMTILVSVVLLLVAIGVLVLVHACSIRSALRSSFSGAGMMMIRSDIANDGQKGLSRDEVEKLPCFEFKVEVGAEASDCAVCLESFLVGDRCRLLPACRHSFHAQCVDSWLLKNSMCPICRASAELGETPPVPGVTMERLW